MAQIAASQKGNGVTGFLSSLADSRAIILGVALLHLVVTYVWVKDWHEEFGQNPGNFYPDSFIVVPLVLLLASICLFVGRAWSYFLAFMICIWVLYSVGYLTFRGVATAHDLPLFTLTPLRLWFTQVYSGQPQQFLQLALAFVTSVYALVAFSRHWLYGEARA